MIIVAQTAGTGLTDLAVNEATFTSQTGLQFETFEFDGADWLRTTESPSAVVDLADYGITFTGTPVANDVISVAQQDSQLWVFQAGDGINATKLNDNFDAMQSKTNNNENTINTLSNTALMKDGSNLTQDIVDDFQSQTPNILSASGTIALTDNTANFLTLTGNGTISLPTITADQYSHTIILVVEGSAYTLDLGVTKHLYNPLAVDTTQTYNVMYVYNKIENEWYYSLTQ